MKKVLGVLLLMGCAPTLKSLERGEWVLVNDTEGKYQEVITLDAHEKEIVEGSDRKVKFAVDDKGPVLHDQEKTLTLAVNEVKRFRLNEGKGVDLLADNACFSTWWTESKRVDGWKGADATEGRESYLYVRGNKPGQGKLKLVDETWGTHEFVVKVTAK